MRGGKFCFHLYTVPLLRSQSFVDQKRAFIKHGNKQTFVEINIDDKSAIFFVLISYQNIFALCKATGNGFLFVLSIWFSKDLIQFRAPV